MMAGMYFETENQREARDYFPYLRWHQRMHPVPNSTDHNNSRSWAVGV